jgi:succinate dehydrogenase flavin-adding protein (antitoxin of CptAB toxin-antitoxin module)
MKKTKKNGSLIIEQLLVFPIMIGIIWLIMQMIIFVYSNNQINTSANETSQVLSQILRGSDEDLRGLSTANREIVEDEALKKIIGTVEKNKFIMLMKDNITGVEYLNTNATTGDVQGFVRYDTLAAGPVESVLLITENKVLCETSLQDNEKRRVICIYTEESDQITSKKSQQMVVRIKAPFHLIGSIIPGVDDKILLYGNGVSTKELTGRFQYY